MRLLVIEDEQGVAKIFRDFFVELGRLARLEANWEAGFAAIERESPHAIFLDLCLPHMTGIEFLQATRHSSIPALSEDDAPVACAMWFRTRHAGLACRKALAYV